MIRSGIFERAICLLVFVSRAVTLEEVHVRYGYFPEARPIHTACARGWFDLKIRRDGADETTLYRVTCYPQTSGNFVASRLDNRDLDIGNLGSTPLAQALARGVDIKVVFITQYIRDSEGIYVRPSEPELNYTGIVNPFDLRGRKIGVPFGSTIHFQLLFLLDLLSLSGEVELLNLSPAEIISHWDNREIDGAGCWGTAKNHLLSGPRTGPGAADSPSSLKANVLISSGVLADWGRPAYTVVAVDRNFAKDHHTFMVHFVGILSRLSDSFIDRLGKHDAANTIRCDTIDSTSLRPGQRSLFTSYLPSLVDSLMVAGQVPGDPSQSAINEHRRALDEFVQQTSAEQVSCDYLGPSPGACRNPTRQHLSARQTADFLLDQKLIGDLGPLGTMGEDRSCQDMNTLCGGAILDGSFILEGRTVCSGCIPVGTYGDIHQVGNTIGEPDQLLLKFEELDYAANKSLFAPFETGRAPAGEKSAGDSTCRNHTVLEGASRFVTGTFGDGANAEAGLSYSDNLKCVWEIRTYDCSDSRSTCEEVVEVQFEGLKLWSGDFIRVYSDPTFKCQPGGRSNVLLGQFSGIYKDSDELFRSVPPLRAVGCIVLVLETDSNQERSYGSGHVGDGFLATYRMPAGCSPSSCSGFECQPDGLCDCGLAHWGGDCSVTKSCLGTKRLTLSESENDTYVIASSAGLTDADFDIMQTGPLVPYPNDLDCTFEIAVPKNEEHVEVVLYYDLEPSFDFIRVQSGSSSSRIVYAVLTGSSHGNPRVLYVPTLGSGMMSLQFITDSRGRRHKGFTAALRASGIGKLATCSSAGYSGSRCELSHCTATSRLSTAIRHFDAGPYVLGRIVSQPLDFSVPAMPWAPDGGCIWHLAPDGDPEGVENVVALRLVFISPLDLEAHPVSAVGDKLVIRTREGGDAEYFVEECRTDEVCSFPWQTGVCGELGHCLLKTTVELNVNDIAGATARLVTDRNDGGRNHSGLDFEALLVQKCPNEDGEVHCERGGGECLDGFCYCEGFLPCSCPCDGNSNVLVRSTGVKIGIVLGGVIPAFVLFFSAFLCYRRRKIRKSRQYKATIEAKEAELEAFRNSVVGMRTAERDYIPKTGVEKSIASGGTVVSETLKVQWCWKETGSAMSHHKQEMIFGNAADCWIKYDGKCNAALEVAFQEQGGVGEYSPLPSYVVDFSTMLQTKVATGFKRNVQRVILGAPTTPNTDLTGCYAEEDLPRDLTGEPQMVLVFGDVIQVSTQRNDGWAFGTKLHHADEAFARQLLSAVADGETQDETNIFTDTGWFRLEVTRVPTGEDLDVLKTSVGDTGALQPPAFWEPVKDPTIAERHELNSSDSEYEAIVNAFQSTLVETGIKVLKVERIQNLAMWQTYVVKRQTICYRETGEQTSAGNDRNVAQRKALERFERRWLWHGTDARVMDKILQQGFNRSFCGKNATRYGKGVYFARDASYSADALYAVPDSRGQQYMIASRVVVGEYCVGTQDAVTPDVRDAGKNILYDSTVALLRSDTMTNPSIYVTYHDAQAYPEYLICFRHLDYQTL